MRDLTRSREEYLDGENPPATETPLFCPLFESMTLGDVRQDRGPQRRCRNCQSRGWKRELWSHSSSEVESGSMAVWRGHPLRTTVAIQIWEH